MSVYVFGFSGKLGSGKDYLASVLGAMLPPDAPKLYLSLADHLKVEAIIKDNLQFDNVFGAKDRDTRRALQRRGTEEGRLKYGEDIWTRALTNWIRLHAQRGIRVFFITDVRFPNELAWLRELSRVDGLVHARAYAIRVHAPQRNRARLDRESKGDADARRRIAEHASETSLDDAPREAFDLSVRNDPGEDAISPLRDLALEISKLEILNTVIFLDLDDTICACARHYEEAIEEAARAANTTSDLFRQAFISAGGYDFERVRFTREHFARALVSALRGDADEATRARVHDIGMAVHAQAFDALPGAVDAVRELCALPHCTVVIFTVGHRADQVRKLARLGLHDLPTEVFAHKDESLFHALKEKYRAKHYFMIGDSARRDIEPARAAGVDHVIHVGASPTLYNRAGDARAWGVPALADAAPVVKEVVESWTARV